MWMDRARSESLWNHTAVLQALIANVNRDPKSAPFEPSDFHPFARERDRMANVIPGDITCLKVFLQ